MQRVYNGNGEPNWDLVPEHTRFSMRLYIERGCHPGGGLVAILSGELFNVTRCADKANWAALKDIVRFLSLYAPYASYGSRESVDAWILKGGLDGYQEEGEPETVG